MITLQFAGGRTFEIRTLTLGQLCELEDALAEKKKSAAQTGFDILTIALSRDHAEIDVAAIEMTSAELTTATRQIIEMAYPPGAANAPGSEPKAAAA